MRLAGQHAVVTGGGGGIGAAIAQALAAEGAKLTLVGRRKGKLEKVAAEIRSCRAKSRHPSERSRGEEHDDLGFARLGPSTSLGTNGVCFFSSDVTDRAQVDVAFAAAREAHGPITILINNAGAAESAAFAKTSQDAWRRILAVNLDALLYCCQAALPDLLAAPAGRIVTIASTAGLKGYAYTAAYVAAKHGAVGLTRALAAEYARTGLTVNAVCPGFTDTKMVAGALDTIVAKTGRGRDEALSELTRFNPQGRLVDPAEVANAVLWLCLPESGAINGQALAVAGGEVM